MMSLIKLKSKTEPKYFTKPTEPKQREATERKKEKLAEERETFAVAPGSPEAGYIPAEIDRRARDVKELDSQKDQEFINRARFIKQAEEMENLGF